MADYRERFKAVNPDKKIIIDDYYPNSGYYCHKARCTYSDNWLEQELVNYVDNGTGNYGGRIENEVKNADGTLTGTIVVYFD